MAPLSTRSDLRRFEFPTVAYCWAVYRWDEDAQRGWDFVRYWDMPKDATMPYIWPFEAMASIARKGPPKWDTPFNMLGVGYAVHPVPYPAPPKWYIIFDSLDPRYNPDLDR